MSPRRPPIAGRFTAEELALAARNRGMPLEAPRHDVTPPGLHYLLIHFDIPDADETRSQLEIGGLVGKPCSLSLSELKAMPAKTLRVTMECAGNRRGQITPRYPSVPWLEEGVSSADWKASRCRATANTHGWTQWQFVWQAVPREHELACRAADAAGNTQPLEPPWDLSGFGNNGVQRIHVTVRP